MAITAALLTAGESSTDASSYASASITPTANTLILAVVTTRGAGAEETPTASGNGLTWVQVATADDSTSVVRTTVFRAMGASPSAGAVTFTFSATQTSAVWSICEFDGIDTSGTDGSGATVQSAVAGTASGTAGTADFTNAFGDAVNNATYSAVAKSNTQNTVVDTGFTELSDTTTATPTLSLQVMWLLGEDQTPAPTWASGVEWAQVAIEIKAAGAGAVTGTIAATQADQTTALSGTVANPVTGTVAASQADQTAAFAGTVTVQITGTIAASQVDQTAIFTGTVANPVTGSIAVTQSDQTMVASGLLTITGTFTATQDAQTAAFTGIVANPVTGTIGVTQANQTAAFVGFMGDITFWQPNPVAYTRNPVAYVPVGADDDPPW